uniref:Putative secreted protein n=1 Tax=Anopheles marajoara TaxID=58244 RepID=A0A2M4C6I7_9DIPT
MAPGVVVVASLASVSVSSSSLKSRKSSRAVRLAPAPPPKRSSTSWDTFKRLLRSVNRSARFSVVVCGVEVVDDELSLVDVGATVVVSVSSSSSSLSSSSSSSSLSSSSSSSSSPVPAGEASPFASLRSRSNFCFFCCLMIPISTACWICTNPRW